MFNFFSEIKQELVNENALLNNFNIINLSNKAIYIEGHKGVAFVGRENISIKVKKSLIIINGKNLKIKKITCSTVLIEGEIKSVEAQ